MTVSSRSCTTSTRSTLVSGSRSCARGERADDHMARQQPTVTASQGFARPAGLPPEAGYARRVIPALRADMNRDPVLGECVWQHTHLKHSFAYFILFPQHENIPWIRLPVWGSVRACYLLSHCTPPEWVCCPPAVIVGTSHRQITLPNPGGSTLLWLDQILTTLQRKTISKNECSRQ